MEIEAEKKDGVVIVRLLERRLDSRASGALREKLMSLVENGADRIVVNFNHVEFIDSSGLSAIVSVLKSMPADGDIVVSEARGAVSQMFKLSRTDKIFPMASEEGGAVSMLATAVTTWDRLP